MNPRPYPLVFRRARAVRAGTLLAGLLLAAGACASERNLLRDGPRAFDPLRGDPREFHLRLGVLYDQAGNVYSDYGLGLDLGLWHRRRGDTCISLSTRGGSYSRFQLFETSIPHIFTDFTGGIALGRREGPHAVELFLFHLSSHLGDEVLAFGLREWQNHSHEAVRLLYSRRLGAWRLYGGPTVPIHGDRIARREGLTLQAGAEFDGAFRGVPFHAALDARGRQRRGFRPSLAATLGLPLGPPTERGGSMRLFLEAYHGYVNSGQYATVRERYLMAGGSYMF